jgi:hypothetical protein
MRLWMRRAISTVSLCLWVGICGFSSSPPAKGAETVATITINIQQPSSLSKTVPVSQPITRNMIAFRLVNNYDRPLYFRFHDDARILIPAQSETTVNVPYLSGENYVVVDSDNRQIFSWHLSVAPSAMVGGGAAPRPGWFIEHSALARSARILRPTASRPGGETAAPRIDREFPAASPFPSPIAQPSTHVEPTGADSPAPQQPGRTPASMEAETKSIEKNNTGSAFREGTPQTTRSTTSEHAIKHAGPQTVKRQIQNPSPSTVVQASASPNVSQPEKISSAAVPPITQPFKPQIYYDTPDTMKQDVAIVYAVEISLNEAVDRVVSTERAHTKSLHESIRLGNEMTATLKNGDDAFTIVDNYENNKRKTQANPDGKVRWAWTVTPKKPGRHYLSLTVNCADDEPCAHFERQVKIEVPPLSVWDRFLQLSDYLKANWTWLSAIGVGLWRKRGEKEKAVTAATREKQSAA